MYYYYQHTASTVPTITVQRCRDRMEAARIIVKEAKEFGYLEEYHEEMLRTFNGEKSCRIFD